MRIVTMTPPGSRPGMIALAIAPAIKPRTIQAMNPMLPPKGWVCARCYRNPSAIVLDKALWSSPDAQF
jgi:hypothetical protein